VWGARDTFTLAFTQGFFAAWAAAATLTMAPSCAHSPACLEAAELHLRDGDWQTAQRVLRYSAGARPPKSAARWMNAVGLSCVLAGDLPSAVAWLEKSLALPFGATHLAAAKTFYWVAHLQPEATHALANVNGSVAKAASLAFGAFQQTRAHVDAISDDSLAEWQLNAGPSIFDLPRESGARVETHVAWKDFVADVQFLMQHGNEIDDTVPFVPSSTRKAREMTFQTAYNQKI